MKLLALLLLIVVSLVGCNKEKEWGVDTYVDGSELMDLCNTETAQKRTACFYYVLGVVDSRGATYASENGKDWLCGDPKRIDIANAVVGYLRAHPDASSQAAGPLVYNAVDKAFGCAYKKDK